MLITMPHNNAYGIVPSCDCTRGVLVTVGEGMPVAACPDNAVCRGVARVDIEQARALLYDGGAAWRNLFGAIEVSEAIMNLKVGG